GRRPDGGPVHRVSAGASPGRAEPGRLLGAGGPVGPEPSRVRAETGQPSPAAARPVAAGDLPGHPPQSAAGVIQAPTPSEQTPHRSPGTRTSRGSALSGP